MLSYPQMELGMITHTLTRMKINRRSFVPVYQQLADILAEQIRAGELAPGDPISGELRLAGDYGVGRATVRKALLMLRSEGLIVTRKGEGTFVREPRRRRVVRVDADTTVTVRMPSAEERLRLDVDEGTPVLVVERPGEDPELLRGDEVTISGM